METTTQKKGYFKDNLYMLATVCCFIFDQEMCGGTAQQSERKSVLDLVQEMKLSDPVLNFPKKIRGSTGRPHYPRQQQHPDQMMIKITTTDHHIHRDLSVLPPMKRHRFDDYHHEDDYLKKRQKCSRLLSGSKRRSLVDDQEEDHDQNEEKKSTSANKKGKRNKDNNKVQGLGRQKQKVIMAGPNPAPPMPSALMEKVVEELGKISDLRLLIQKSLYESDLKKVQNRISMPINQLESADFLSDEEKRQLASRMKDDDKHFQGIELDFFEPNLRKSKMTLKKWDYHNCSSYMLSQHWFAAAERNKLRAGDVVQIWFFRSREGNNPCIALVNLSQENVSSSSSCYSSVVDLQRSASEQRSDVNA